MSSISLVIFDLDGTLLDTIQDLAAATNFALTQLGRPIQPVEDYPRFVGHGVRQLFRNALAQQDASERLLDQMQDYFTTYYRVHGSTHTTAYEGVKDLLHQLQSQGVQLAIASNKYQEGVDQLVQHFFGEFDWAATLGQREGVPKKPDPQIIHDILSQVRVAPEQCLYVGDMEIDLLTGQRAGVKTVGVTWGFCEEAFLRTFNPFALVHHPIEIVQLV